MAFVRKFLKSKMSQNYYFCKISARQNSEKMLNIHQKTRQLPKEITEKFEKSHINGQKLKINMATLIYYPVPNDEDPTECTLVPAWDFKVSSNGVIGEIILNALDGSHLSILYLD